MAASLRIDPVRSRADARAFLALPYGLHRDDPRWVPPLRSTERERWTPRKNPALERLRAERFLARRGRRVVGRVAASLDPRFAEWAPGTGFVGFFECEEDPAAALALLGAAEERLRAWGCDRALGPVNLTTHDEVGLLVDGFDRRPAVLTPYGPPYYPELVEGAGYRECREYRAWEWTPASPRSPALERLARRGAWGDVRVRPMDPRRFEEEVRVLHGLYNRSFRDVWGFVEMGWPEFLEQARSFRPFYRPELIVIAEVEDDPVGFAVVLPDINEVLARLRGRLLPLGWLRLLREVPRIRSARFLLLGVVEEHRGRGVAPLLAESLRGPAAAAELERVEVSLVLASNERMNRVIEAMGCVPTRTFRLYEKALAGPPAPPS